MSDLAFALVFAGIGAFVGMYATLMIYAIKQAKEPRLVMIVTNSDGDCVAVTRTNEDHRIVQIVWQR